MCVNYIEIFQPDNLGLEFNLNIRERKIAAGFRLLMALSLIGPM